MKLPNEEQWQVPVHTSTVFSGKAHAFALVIPVINEGERIRAQLARVFAANLPVDVVIADGGSIDGSLDEVFLRSSGVRALLTKAGPGKLSAQLRMAYAWCLREGYKGIVTVDGNGKDNVEAVEAFVAALQEGFDYIQGSRYRLGGKAENTPLARTIGNRLIHAPLLSLAGRNWFTDTTNGFRAYSARFLLDPRVQPFRDVFSVYNMLFYLTVRAKPLGYRVTEIPVIRSYPASGNTPTKISGLSGLLSLLSEALNAATGAYSPKNQPAQNRFPVLANVQMALFGVVCLALLTFAISMFHRSVLNPDGWTNIELAKSFAGDVYRIHVTRQFGTLSEYSSSFPPLWPALLYLTDLATGVGAASGFCLAIIAAALFVWMSELAGRRHFDTQWIGFGAAVLVLSHSGLINEILGGRSIPLQLVLYAVLLWVLGYPRTVLRYAVAGLCCGLTLMNRFDAMPFAIVITLLVIFTSGAPRGKLAYTATFLLSLTPWIYLSRLRFHRWFATDNSDISLRVDPTAFVTDWWPDRQATVFDEPAHWLAKVAGNAVDLVPTAILSPGLTVLALWVIAFLTVAAFASLLLIANPSKAQRLSIKANVIGIAQQHQILLLFYLAILTLLVGYVITGYLDARYFVPQIWLTVFIVLGLVAAKLANQEQRDLFGFIVAAIFTTTTLILLAKWAVLTPQNGGQSDTGTKFDQAVERCIFATTNRPVLLSVNATAASRWSALYGWNTVLLPANFDRLTVAQVKQFSSIYKITHVHVDDTPLQAIGARLALELDTNCPRSVMALSN